VQSALQKIYSLSCKHFCLIHLSFVNNLSKGGGPPLFFKREIYLDRRWIKKWEPRLILKRNTVLSLYVFENLGVNVSMIACFLAISQDELDALYDEPSEIAAVLDGEYAAQIIDIDKAWHGIHFMLTENNPASSPLAHAVLGNKKIGEEDVGYGPAQGIAAGSVKQIADTLNGVSEQAFRAMFDVKAMTNSEIYPDIWDEGEESLSFLLAHFKVLQGFYADAAKAGKAVIAFLN
jgi:Domain of unknown function (DUF1877)